MTYIPNGAPGTLTDGDKGDITVSGSGAAFTVDAGVVTFAKMQAVSANVLLGNDASGTAVEEITCTAAGRALLDDANAAAQLATIGAAASSHTHAAADVTSGVLAIARLATGTPDGTKFIRDDGTLVVPTVADGSITFAKMQAVSANVLLGNDATGTVVEEIACTAAGRALLDDANAAAQLVTIGAAATSHSHAAADITSGVLAIGRLATGTPDGTKFVRDDGTLAVPPVPDGDRGDITVSGSGATFTVDTGVITLAKMANMATASLVGRNTGGAGVPEVLSTATVKTMLDLSGTNTGDQGLSSRMFLVMGA